MASSVEIPQDIIYNIVAAVGDDKNSLKQCALVSSSFLLPSRRQLFSKVSLERECFSQGLHQFLVQNPVIQTFIRNVAVIGHLHYEVCECLLDSTSLLAILRLPLCCLESFSIEMRSLWTWRAFSSELMDAISNIIHSSALKTLNIRKLVSVPMDLLLGIHLTKLELHSCDFDSIRSRSLAPAVSGVVTTSHTVIEQCVWCYGEQVLRPNKPIFLPFICRVRDFEVVVQLNSAGLQDVDILSLLMQSLRASLISPATLEHLKFTIWFHARSNLVDNHDFYDNLRDADVWNHLDSIITHPIGSRLQRVEIDINYEPLERAEREMVGAVLHSLPLLREKGVLFVEATAGRSYGSDFRTRDWRV